MAWSAASVARFLPGVRTAVLVALIGLAVAAPVVPSPNGGSAPAVASRLPLSVEVASGGGYSITELRRSVPAGFVAVMGYSPEVAAVDGGPMLVKPGGDCSVPTGSTRYGFGSACRAHDYGYDLLRYYDREGSTLSPTGRARVDDALDRRLHQRCDDIDSGPGRLWCRTTALAYATGARVNSWLEHYRAPGHGINWSYPVAGAAIAATLVGTFLRRRWAERRITSRAESDALGRSGL